MNQQWTSRIKWKDIALQVISSMQHTCVRTLVVEQHIKLPRGDDAETKICQRELFWIDTLDALQPKGLNEEFNTSVIL